MTQRQTLQFQHVQSEQLRLTQQMMLPIIFQNNQMMLQMMWPFFGPWNSMLSISGDMPGTLVYATQSIG